MQSAPYSWAAVAAAEPYGSATLPSGFAAVLLLLVVAPMARGRLKNLGNKKARPFRRGGKRRAPRKK